MPEKSREAEVDVATPTVTDHPRPDGSDIHTMTAGDIEPVGRALAQAFFDDPHMRWIVRDDAKRMGRLERGFATFIRRVWLPKSESFTHERLIGAAHWMPPDGWHIGVLAQLALLPAIMRELRIETPRLLKALTYQEKKHPRHPPHWYLAAIGVVPAWQGRGFGSALMRPVLKRCDADRVPAYLEAGTPRSRALYERNGFKVVEECKYADDGPPFWRMWRELSAHNG
jgi:ribosomal protein S18 acetylase RimI-like enzyme